MISNYIKFDLRRIVYDLKKRHSNSVKWLRFVSESTNLETGKMTNVYTDCIINKAIVISVKILRDAFAKGQFAYGGNFDTCTRILIIDQKDLPSDWRISFDSNDRVIIDDQKYVIKECENFEFSTIWLIGLVGIKGSELNDVTSKTVEHGLGMYDESINA